MFLKTRGLYHYQEFSMSVMDRTSLVFSVRACANVHILLATEPGTVHQHAYEVTIGYMDNTMSYIREEIGGTKKHEVKLS